MRKPSEEKLQALWLEEVLKTIWMLREDYHSLSIPELANEAGLAASTVFRLYTGVTKDCKSSTLRKLAKAVGLRLEWVPLPDKRKKAA